MDRCSDELTDGNLLVHQPPERYQEHPDAPCTAWRREVEGRHKARVVKWLGDDGRHLSGSHVSVNDVELTQSLQLCGHLPCCRCRSPLNDIGNPAHLRRVATYHRDFTSPGGQAWRDHADVSLDACE